ncbi:MAG: hypothetical protein KAI24_02355 [Planctomycetes bacterium]|nr:hypothetical protein [Planctomycetota bacterium]
MQVNCKSCGAQVPAEDLNLERMVAKCARCDAVFAFRVDGQEPLARGAAGRPASGVARPKALQIDRLGGELTITRRWGSGCAVVLFLAFTLLWNGLCWTGFFVVLNAFPPAAIFVGLFLAVGVGLAYLTLTLMFNSTVITVGRELVVRHGPLPVPGNRTIPRADLDQLYVVQVISSGRSNRGHRTSVSHRLRARLQDGSGVTLLRAVADVEEALYLEEVIERELGIENEPVRGEV